MATKPQFLGFNRSQELFEDVTPSRTLRGVLRGVTRFDKGNLLRARGLTVFSFGEGRYLVTSPRTLEQWDPEEGDLYSWLQAPKFERRQTVDWRTGERISIEDLDGYNSYWVHTADKHVTPCHCRWMYMDGEAGGVPCKHLLACLMHEEHPVVLEEMNKALEEQAIIEGLKS